jgi:glycosyltransferase involved in cell wall biosynthesis
MLDMLGTVSRRRHDYSVAQIDVFSGAGFLWAEAVARRLRSLGKPFVLTLHGGNLPSFGRRWPRRVEALLAMASAVTCPSRYLIEELSHFRDDIQLLPNPIDLESYAFRHRERVAPRLIWLRAFHEIYNPTLAVRALGLVRSKLGSAHLSMIGPDKGDGTLGRVERLVDDSRLSGSVTIQGGIPKGEVPLRLAEDDIFLNTSLIDNAPVSVIEPMACGLCVVSTRVGGIDHLLSDGEDSLLVPSDDANAMAQAVLRLVREPWLASRLSSAGRRKAEELDWSEALPRWVRLLTSVAQGERPRGERPTREEPTGEQH